MDKVFLKNSLLGIILLVILSLAASIWLPISQSFRLVFGVVFLLFLPGFFWSSVFWQKGGVDAVERLTISLLLSIGLVPLAVYWFHKIGVKINAPNVTLEVSAVITLGIVVLLFRQYWQKSRNVKP